MFIRVNRNARRTKDVALIMQAVQAYYSGNGSLPPGIDTDAGSVQIIGSNAGICAVIACPRYALPASQCAIGDLGTSLRPYLENIPADPKTGTDSDTRYFINQDARQVVTVGACDPESEDPSDVLPPPVIEVTQ